MIALSKIPEWASYILIAISVPLTAHFTAALTFSIMYLVHGATWETFWQPYFLVCTVLVWIAFDTALVYFCARENKTRKALVALALCLFIVLISLFGVTGLLGMK